MNIIQYFEGVFKTFCKMTQNYMEIVGRKKAAGAQGASRRTRGKPRCFYIEIQPKALATELARMMAAKMGHR